MKQVVGILSFAAIFFCATNFAFAYTLPSDNNNQPTSQNIDVGITMPQLPSGTLSNLNWQGFINGLPVQNFVNSLQNAKQSIAGSSVPAVIPQTITNAVGQNILGQIDNWTSAHLGFRFSGFAAAALGALSWLLAAAKTGVDWLIGFFK